MKRCRKCGETKSVDKFPKIKEKVGARCRECLNERQKAYRHKKGYELNSSNKSYTSEKSKESFTLYVKERNRLFKDKYGFSSITAYRVGLQNILAVIKRDGKKCKICTTKEDLTIDHIDGRGRHFLENGLAMNNDPKNLRFLCRSCHGRISVKHRYALSMNGG